MHIRSLRQALVENLIDLISIKSGLMISESIKRCDWKTSWF